jgi:transketolase
MSDKALCIFAEQIRAETLKEFACLGFGHLGGSLSVVDLLAVLYGKVMRVDPQNPQWDGRDYLIMSKGHAGPALYAALALKGFFPLETLRTLNQPRTHLPSHCNRILTPGIDMSTGSLGQGISVAVGLTLGLRRDGKDNFVYAVIGDGECGEGQIWEGVLSAAHHKLDRLILFVDYNKQQLDGYTDDILSMGDFKAKFEAFGWHTQRVNGHDTSEIESAVRVAKTVSGKPHVVISDTVKGKGSRIAEGKKYNHHITFRAEDLAQDIAEVTEKIKRLEAGL